MAFPPCYVTSLMGSSIIVVLLCGLQFGIQGQSGYVCTLPERALQRRGTGASAQHCCLGHTALTAPLQNRPLAPPFPGRLLLTLPL